LSDLSLFITIFLTIYAIYGVRMALAVDHIKPKSAGGTNDAAKLQALCHQCHAMKTAKEGAGGGAMSVIVTVAA
jgi:5-methylcytosine-specific restriction endonuclease McrA